MKILTGKLARLVYQGRSVWHTSEKQEAAPAHPHYQYRLPRNQSLLPEVLQAAFLTIADTPAELPVRYIYSLKNVYLSRPGAVFRNFRIFLPSLIHPSVLDQYSGNFLLKQWLGSITAAPTGATVALVHNQFSAINYFHWLIEALPRLIIVKITRPDCYLAVPAPVPEFIAMTAGLLGFNNLLPIAQEQIVKASHVLLPEATHVEGHQDPYLMQQVREQLLQGLGYQLKKPFRRIYVSRSRQRMRKLLNEAELDALLDRYEFETVYFEDMSFQEQVKTVLEASILMGVHGANLTNMLFMQPDAVLVELMNEQAPNLVYFRMASYLSLHYYCVPCAVAAGEEKTNNANLMVATEFVDQLLQGLVV